MSSIPGWPSLTEPDFKCVRPNPMPGNISDFDVEITRYHNRLEDARAQLRRNRDARRMEEADITENRRYIARLKRMMAELTAKGKKVDETFQMNIESAEEAIEESKRVLAMLPEHAAPWEEVKSGCQQWLTWLRKARAQGISRKTGRARLCAFRDTTTGVPCGNEVHFRDKIGWRYCTIAQHKQ